MIILAITYEPEKAQVNLQILTPGPHSHVEIIEALAAARLQYVIMTSKPRPLDIGDVKKKENHDTG